MSRTTKRHVENLARTLGLAFDTWSPGDGATRYRFGLPGEPDDYFAMHALFTCLGPKEAFAFLRGWAVCWTFAGSEEEA